MRHRVVGHERISGRKRLTSLHFCTAYSHWRCEGGPLTRAKSCGTRVARVKVIILTPDANTRRILGSTGGPGRLPCMVSPVSKEARLISARSEIRDLDSKMQIGRCPSPRRVLNVSRCTCLAMASSPFFIGPQPDSRPSTAGTNPFASRPATPPPLPGPADSPRVAIADVPRNPSYYGSRAPTQPSRNSSHMRMRETFAAPPSRPLTAHSALAPSKKASRMRSTLLDDPSTIDKPWVANKDPYARIAYFLTYGVAFLGIVASAVRCYFGYKSVPMLSGNLCMVLDEGFDTDTDTVFAAGGNWFREIELGGFG